MATKTTTSSGSEIQDLESESALVGCCLLGGADALTIAWDRLHGLDDLTDSRHQVILGSLASLQDDGRPIDMVTLQSQLKHDGQLESSGGIDYLVEIAEGTPVHEQTATLAVRSYAEAVRARAERRRALATLQRAQQRLQELPDDTSSVAEDVHRELSQIFESGGTSHATRIGEAANSLYETLERIHTGEQEISVPTSLPDLDYATGGLWPGQQVVVGARPGVGKSAFALHVAMEAAKRGTGVAFYSLEMTQQQLAERAVARAARQPLAVTRGQIEPMEEQWSAMADAAGRLGDYPLWCVDSRSLRPSKLKASARWMHARQGVGLIVVDYLQLMRGDQKGENRATEIAEITRELKTLAMELEIPVVTLVQLNRESEKDKRKPRLSDIRESGSTEQDADVVLFMHDESDEGAEDRDMQILVAKQRQGRRAEIDVRFYGQTQQFANIRGY